MKAFTREAWERGEVDVWLYRHTSQGREILRPNLRPEALAPRWRWEPVSGDHEMPDPTFSLPADAMTAILEEAQTKAHGPAIADAVADARQVRDRLLTMIEAGR